MSDEDVDTRLHDVSQILYKQETGADYWEYGWGTFDAGTMIWSAVQAGGERDRKARGADIVQASESLVGLADVIFRPLPAFDADLACLSQETQSDARKCLAAKEELLQRSDERARDPYELLPHLANAGFNLTAGLIVWKVGGGGRALVTAVPGEIIGELQLWTIPTGPISDFDRYKIRFSPLLLDTGHDHNPAAGVNVSWRF